MLAPAFAPRRLGDLLRALEKRGCKIQGIGGMTAPCGTISYRRIVRVVADGEPLSAQIPNMDNGDTLIPYVGRSLCVQLGFDPADFGL